MATTQFNETSEAIHQVRKRFIGALRQQAEHIKKLDEGLKLLQNEHRQLEEIAAHLIEPLEKGLASADKAKAWTSSGILSSIRKISGATYAEQVFALLAEEAARMNVRSAVFDVRGRAAWGSSACGFDPELSDDALRTLVIPLHHEGPFQRAYETGETVETDAKSLARNRTVMAKLNPAMTSNLLLIPVRSAGSVVAVFYAEITEIYEPILIDSMKVLVEFAGAQIDRLMVIDGGLAEAGPATMQGTPEIVSEPETLAPEREAETRREPEVISSHGNAEVAAPGFGPVESSGPPSEGGTGSPASQETAELVGEHQSAVPTLDITQLSEEQQKVHRDAQRFSRLLVSEIELYNMNGVQEGRKNRDLYLRLKKDIDRSRETYEKRFSSTVAKKVDYFHEELVRRLAENDPSLLGSEYPGSSV